MGSGMRTRSSRDVVDGLVCVQPGEGETAARLGMLVHTARIGSAAHQRSCPWLSMHGVILVRMGWAAVSVLYSPLRATAAAVPGSRLCTATSNVSLTVMAVPA